MYRWCRKLRSTTGYKLRSLPGSELLDPSWTRFPKTVKHPTQPHLTPCVLCVIVQLMIPFRVELRVGVSLCEQVVYAATKAMISGQLRPGDPFPSVRALSKEFKINPNTAHKVVTQLIALGL